MTTRRYMLEIDVEEEVIQKIIGDKIIISKENLAKQLDLIINKYDQTGINVIAITWAPTLADSSRLET